MTAIRKETSFANKRKEGQEEKRDGKKEEVIDSKRIGTNEKK